MRCEGAESPPCKRCRNAGLECMFEKPSREASLTGEAGLESVALGRTSSPDVADADIPDASVASRTLCPTSVNPSCTSKTLSTRFSPPYVEGVSRLARSLINSIICNSHPSIHRPASARYPLRRQAMLILWIPHTQCLRQARTRPHTLSRLCYPRAIVLTSIATLLQYHHNRAFICRHQALGILILTQTWPRRRASFRPSRHSNRANRSLNNTCRHWYTLTCQASPRA
jgi:hypothetical protein